MIVAHWVCPKEKKILSPMGQRLTTHEQSCLFYTAVSVAARVGLDIQILAVGNNNHLKTVTMFES